MTKDEFMYSDPRSIRASKFREWAERRGRFYDWWMEHKDDDLPTEKEIAKKFDTTQSTISVWITKLL